MSSEALDVPTGRSTDTERTQYAGLMEKIKLRINTASQAIQGEVTEATLVCAAAHLRIAIEETVLASLVANKHEVDRVGRSLRTKSMDKTRKLVQSINPQYWPVGTESVNRDGEIEWLDLPDQIHEDEYVREWGRLSRLLHAGSPYLEPIDYSAELRGMGDTIRRLMLTLGHHHITLVGGTHKLVCTVGTNPVRVYLFARVDGT